MKQKWVIGNWKSNGTTQMALDFLAELRGKSWPEHIQAVICPPKTLLGLMIVERDKLPLNIGAQNLSPMQTGAYTGEVAAEMLADVGTEFVIVGHSERREHFAESTEQLAAKIIQAIEHNIRPIYCVGEPLAIREQNSHIEYIEQQINDIIAATDINIWANCLIAYEPIWAIGTGERADNQQIAEIHALIRNTFAQHSDTIARTLPILYGGSVNPDNAEAIFSIPNVDGGLIGGASLKAKSFAKLIDISANISV